MGSFWVGERVRLRAIEPEDWELLAKREEKLEIPYGVAIAFGGLWLISERFLNQFG